MQEVFVDVREHARRCLKAMVCGLETCVLVAVLVRSVAGEDGRNVEDYRGFFVGEAVLRRRFVGESIEPIPMSALPYFHALAGDAPILPSKADPYMILINWKPQI